MCPLCVPFPIPRASWLPYVPQFPHHPVGHGAGPARPGGCDPPSPPPPIAPSSAWGVPGPCPPAQNQSSRLVTLVPLFGEKRGGPSDHHSGGGPGVRGSRPLPPPCARGKLNWGGWGGWGWSGRCCCLPVPPRLGLSPRVSPDLLGTGTPQPCPAPGGLVAPGGAAGVKQPAGGPAGTWVPQPWAEPGRGLGEDPEGGEPMVGTPTRRGGRPTGPWGGRG